MADLHIQVGAVLGRKGLQLAPLVIQVLRRHLVARRGDLPARTCVPISGALQGPAQHRVHKNGSVVMCISLFSLRAVCSSEHSCLCADLTGLLNRRVIMCQTP